MKKVVSYLFFIAAIGMLAASCTPHKQACAAYNKVELSETPSK